MVLLMSLFSGRPLSLVSTDVRRTPRVALAGPLRGGGAKAPATPRPKALLIACLHHGPQRPSRLLMRTVFRISMLSDTQPID